MGITTHPGDKRGKPRLRGRSAAAPTGRLRPGDHGVEFGQLACAYRVAVHRWSPMLSPARDGAGRQCVRPYRRKVDGAGLVSRVTKTSTTEVNDPNAVWEDRQSTRVHRGSARPA